MMIRFVDETKSIIHKSDKVKPKLNEAEAQKIHRDVHTFGSGAFEIDGDKINHVPQDEVVLKRGRGRPASGKAKSAVERKAESRARKKTEHG